MFNLDIGARPLMDYYPLFLDIRGRDVLVVGGGRIALEKITNLLKAGARITVVADRILPKITRFSKRVTCIQRVFEPADISERYAIIFGATGDHGLNAKMAD